VYEHYEDTVTIGVYDDHAASAGSDELEYAYLCDGCAEGRDVTCLSTVAAGEWYAATIAAVPTGPPRKRRTIRPTAVLRVHPAGVNPLENA
jgi:hypothetical protein